jgi:hypothetical protein
MFGCIALFGAANNWALDQNHLINRGAHRSAGLSNSSMYVQITLIQLATPNEMRARERRERALNHAVTSWVCAFSGYRRC